jgi:hypothetical protein
MAPVPKAKEATAYKNVAVVLCFMRGIYSSTPVMGLLALIDRWIGFGFACVMRGDMGYLSEFKT